MSLGSASVLPGKRPSISELIKHGSPTFSFEFFPPKTDAGEATLWQAMQLLLAAARFSAVSEQDVPGITDLSGFGAG